MGTEFIPFVKEAFKKTLVRGGMLFCFAHIIDNYIGFFGYGVGPSMIPTINANTTETLILAETVSTRLGKVGPGDVVLLRSSQNPTKSICKRIIAMEGQTVTYLLHPREGNQQKTVTVPKGHIWIEGDNKNNSMDSRVFGPVPYGLLQGRAIWKVWPLKEFGPLD